MENHFIIDIDSKQFEFLSMNVIKPQLFQVYVEHGGNKIRYHIKADGKGNFVFALHDEIPVEIVKYEHELSERIKHRYDLQ